MNKTLNKDNIQASSQDRHGRVSLFTQGWLNNLQGRSETKQKGTSGWPTSLPSIYALPMPHRLGDRASGACGRTVVSDTLLTLS